MTSDEILERYYEFALDGPALIPFVEEVLKGNFGPPDGQSLLRFLDRIEFIILGNIEDRYDEGPGIEVDVDRVREETAREINQARAVVLDAHL